jgi:hypothetical protein
MKTQKQMRRQAAAQLVFVLSGPKQSQDEILFKILTHMQVATAIVAR